MGPKNCMPFETTYRRLSTQTKKEISLSLSLSNFLSESTLKGPLLQLWPHGVLTEDRRITSHLHLCPLHLQLVLVYAFFGIGDERFDDAVVLGMFWSNDEFELLVRGLPPKVALCCIKLCLALSPGLCIEQIVFLCVIRWCKSKNICIIMFLHFENKEKCF